MSLVRDGTKGFGADSKFVQNLTIRQLADARQQVQDIAVKAIEGASGARALSHINQIAMEPAKNRPQG